MMSAVSESVPNEIAQKVFDSLLSQQFQEVIPHLTMNIVQKLMPMMTGASMDINEVVEEFGLRNTKIGVNGMTVTYNTPPAKLITHWVFAEDNYKINDFEHKINWFWVVLHFFKVRRFKAKIDAARAQSAPV